MVSAISSRSCTERHGDFSESVGFHSSYKVSCCLLGSLFVCSRFALFGLLLVLLDW